MQNFSSVQATRQASRIVAAMWLAIVHYTDAAPADVLARNPDEFRQAVAQAKPGTRILLSSGHYPGGFYFSDLRGETNHPIVIAAADPANPPVIQGGGTGFHLSRPCFIELHDLVISNMAVNGLNIDDGGSFDRPAHHLVLRGLKVSDVGPGGNHDCMKFSGVHDFRVENCQIERWGTGGGSGIDMVGCHNGVIESNLFRHTDSIGSTGVQAKGGTSRLTVRRNRFENAGGRAVNIGGSTGLQFFRPPLKAGEEHCEAKDICVEGNTFIGGGAPVAFVGVDGASVRFNTIYHPKRWAVRILQENGEPGFVPSRKGEFSDNLVAFNSRDWAEGGVNIGPGTAPDTFTFARNWWYCLDDPARSQPKLPVEETGRVCGKDPLFRDVEHGDVRLQPGTPANRVGADALTNLFRSSFQGLKAGEQRQVAGIPFCWCPPGTFMMGSPPDEPERRPDEAQVQVTLTRGFWMAKFETTQGHWKRVMGNLPGPLTAELPEGDDFPVGNVNFAEAEAFCAKLTELGRQSGDLPKDWEFRLPTEAQWEYACRAGTTTATAFGNSLSSKQANFKGKPYNGAESGPSLGRAAKVGSYPPNAWGLHDMHGNTFEWCRDWYHPKLPGGADPDLYLAKDFSRVRRGGCWSDEGWPCRSAFRLRFEPERRYDHIGFRVVAVQIGG
jgi:formylglycine-generating enzyme